MSVVDALVAGVVILATGVGGRLRTLATFAADRFAADRSGAETVWQTERAGEDLTAVSSPEMPIPVFGVPGATRPSDVSERIAQRHTEAAGETPPVRTDGGSDGDQTDSNAGGDGAGRRPRPGGSTMTDASGDKPPEAAAQWPATHWRVVAAICLLVVGLVLALAFPLFVGELQAFGGPATVETFDPTEQPGAATADPEVVDIEARAANGSARLQTAIEEAVTTGEYRYTGNDVPEDLAELADRDRFPSPQYAVFEGRYYAWHSDAGPVGPDVNVELEELTPEEAMDGIATPYDEIPSSTQVVIDGEDPRGVAQDVVVRDDTYYAISTNYADRFERNRVGWAVRTVVAGAASLLLPVGVAFVVVGAWLLVRLSRRRPTAIGRTSAPMLAVVAGVIAGGLVFNGSSSVFVAQHATVAAGLVGLVVAGDRMRRGHWLRVGAIAFGVPVVVLVVSVAAGGLAGLFSAPLGLAAAGATGWPLLCYGYFLGRAPGSETRSAPDTAEGERPDVD